MDTNEAALWATSFKFLTDMMTMVLGRKITPAELDSVINNEEVHSKLLEDQRHSL